MSFNWPLASTTWGQDEVSAGISILESGNTTMGKDVKYFETEFADYFGSKFAIMANSGSSANLLILAALLIKFKNRIRPGMEIIVPAVSWATTYYPVNQCGFTLRFVDVDIDTLCISTESIKAAINENTFAIFAVNLLGQPAPLQELKNLADDHNLILIEDNCESMGAEIGGKACGTFGLAGSFSTFYSHHINTMEGGMVLTDDEELKDIITSLRAHGWTRELDDTNHIYNKSGDPWEDKFRFVLPGFNFRPLEISGRIGSIQLKKLEGFLENRRENMNMFNETFGSVPGIKLQSGPGSSSSFGFSMILENFSGVKFSKVVSQLQQLGVETRPIVSGNFTKQPVMKFLNFQLSEKLQNADIVHNSGFFIGNHHFDLRHSIKNLKEPLLEIIYVNE